MNELLIYLELGIRHIADLSGYDHILFVAALALAYTPSEWKQLALLVTAFTLGHSISLAAATLGTVPIPSSVIETLIPATIIVAAMQAVIEQHRPPRARLERKVGVLRYSVTALFGLVHGLGFSTYLRALLGQSEGIVRPLLAFNIGLEIGQLLILAVVLVTSAIAVRTVFTERDWVHLAGGATGGIALVMLVERLATALQGA